MTLHDIKNKIWKFLKKLNNFSTVNCFQHHLESSLWVVIKFDIGAWQLGSLAGAICFGSNNFEPTLGTPKVDILENVNFWLSVSGQACIQSSLDLVESSTNILTINNLLKLFSEHIYAFQVVKDAKKMQMLPQIASFRGVWFDFFPESKTTNICSFERHSLIRDVNTHPCYGLPLLM